jgi:tRNA (mo5U34)-methyltransferase
VTDSPGGLDANQVRERVGAFRAWYHRIELAPGVVTPGINDSPHVLGVLDDIGLPRDLTGLRVLDLGCRDGFFAFEAERRGAREVVGVDYCDPAKTGFNIAAEILASRVSYRVLNVYDISPQTLGKFDVVLFLGLLYHLRDPLLALDRIRAMQEPGGLLFAETQLSQEREVLDSPLPLWQFFAGAALNGDATNRWAPNLAGLGAAISEAEYEILVLRGDARGIAAARAKRDDSTSYFRSLDRGLRQSS